MKLIIAFFTIIALNSNIFAATTSGETTILETLSEHNLHLAYQDFLDYRSTHPEAYDPTLQSPIAFAYELGRERFEHKLAFKMLNSDEVSDPSTFSEEDQKALHSILVWAPIAKVASALETAPKLWLIHAIYEIFPNDAHFFDIAKRADSKDVEVRRQAATELFDVMTASIDLKTKRYAAEIATDTRDNNWKSFLNDEQLGSAREVLTTAINDESLSIEQRLSFACSLIWAANADGKKRLGTEEQRQAILDTIFSFAGREDLSPHQRLTAAELVIDACSFHNPYVYTTPEKQRLAAIAIIENLIDHHPQIHKIPSLFGFSHESLLTEEQTKKLERHFQQILHNGRNHEKARILNQVAYNKVSLEFKRAAVEQSLTIPSQFFTSSENSRTFMDILSAHDQSNNNPIATDEERAQAIQKLRPLMKSPEICIHWGSHVVENILSQRDASHANYLAPQEAITEAIEYGLNLLGSNELGKHSRFWLVKSIFGNNHTLTEEQFNMLFPSMLFALSAEEEDEYQKENDVNSLLNSTHITPEQQQQVLQVFIDEMNNPGKPEEIRKKRAEFIKSSTHATAEQKAAAAIVLGEKTTPEPTLSAQYDTLAGTDTALLLHAVHTGDMNLYMSFHRSRVKYRINRSLDILAPGDDQIELIDPSANYSLSDRTKGVFKIAVGDVIDTLQITAPSSYQLRDLARTYDASVDFYEHLNPFMDTVFMHGDSTMNVLTNSDKAHTRDELMWSILASAEENSPEETGVESTITFSQDLLDGTDTVLLLQAMQTGDMLPYLTLCKEQLKSRISQFVDSITSGDDQMAFIDPTIHHYLLPSHTKGAFKTTLNSTIDVAVIETKAPTGSQLSDLTRAHNVVMCELNNAIAEFMATFNSYEYILNPGIVINQEALSITDIQEDIRTSNGLSSALTSFCW